MGWTRIYPFNTTGFETHSKLTKCYTDYTAEVLLEFGDKLEDRLLLSAHCLNTSKNYCYKLKISTLNDDTIVEKSYVSIPLNEYISYVSLYETNSLLNELDDYDKKQYLSDALIIRFNKGNLLSIKAEEGDDEHEPCIILQFWTEDEYPILEVEALKNWKLRDQL